MKPKTSTLLIYLFTAAVTSAFMLSNDFEGQKGSTLYSFWLAIFGPLLLFIYAYARLLFVSMLASKSHRVTVLLHALAAILSFLAFLHFALPYPHNPVRDAGSPVLIVFPLIALPVFLVAGLSLLFRNKSSLAIFASVLIWPYLLFAALASLNRFFYENPPHGAYYFLCFLSPCFFAFAAGAVDRRPTLAHAMAICGGAFSLPRMYWTVLRDYELVNPWIMFNVPDNEIGTYDQLHPGLVILAVTLVVLVTAIAIISLLPHRWQFRKIPLFERTWLAYAGSSLFLVLWFCQSVMPYRIPGALDYSDYPILQILHVEKHGLQFHETAVSVYRRGRVSVSRIDRRLFEYRFQQKRSGGVLPQELIDRVHAIVRSPDYAKAESARIKPVRAWNAEDWYLVVEGPGIHSYTKKNRTSPPKEIVVLFHDLETSSRSEESPSELKDVCLGFCFDPLSDLGSLYSNHRCFNAGHGTHCS